MKLRCLHALEWVLRWLQPIFGTIVVLSGAFLTYDYKAAKARSPGISSLLDFVQSWIGAVFFSFAVSTLILSLLQSLIRPSLKSLQQRATDLQNQVDLVAENLRDVFDALMLEAAGRINVAQADQVRVSLYYHNGNGAFLLCGRYAPNPEHRKSGRAYYPDTQGCVSRGWQNGWIFDNDFGDNRRYRQKNRADYGIDTATLDRIRMQSKLFAVQRVEASGRPVGVLVVEALDPARFTEADLQQPMQECVNVHGPIVNAFRNFIPDPARARAKGL